MKVNIENLKSAEVDDWAKTYKNFVTEQAKKLFLNKRVAQAILRRFNQHQEIEFVDELSETERGGGGFGSTGH